MFRLSQNTRNRGTGWIDRYKKGQHGLKKMPNDVRSAGIFSMITGREFEVEQRNRAVTDWWGFGKIVTCQNVLLSLPTLGHVTGIPI